MPESAACNARSDRHQETNRLLCSPLSWSILGEQMAVDFYARIGFRFLGLPAWSGPDALGAKLQKFRALTRLNPARGRADAIFTISDSHLDAAAVLAAVAKLQSPSHRLVAEIFWLHVDAGEFSRIQDSGSLASPRVVEGLAKNGRQGIDQSRFRHAVALARHCQAIERELDFLETHGMRPEGQWESVLADWRQVCESDAFWQYLANRAAALDDPRVKAEDAQRARAEVPRVILGLHELFAERYASLGNFAECRRHLQLILNSGFSPEPVSAVFAGAVRRIAGKRLESLLRRTQQAVEVLPMKLDRAKFEAAAGPLVAEAREIHAFLTKQLDIPTEVLAESAFDQVATALLQATDKNLSYEGDHRERNFVYASLFLRRLAALPLSAEIRRKVEHSRKENNRYVYSRVGLDAASCPDVTRCFFAEGLDADVDASLVLPMYRINGRKVEVERTSWGVRVSWENARLLVPRSAKAAAAKRGSVEIETPEADYTDAQRQAAARLLVLDGEAQKARAALESQREAALREEDQRGLAALDAARKRCEKRVGEIRQALERQRADEARQIEAEAARLHADLARADAASETARQSAQARSAQRQKYLTGSRSWLTIELPAVLGLALLLHWADVLNVFSLVLGGAGMFGLGKLIRSGLAPWVAAPIGEAEKGLAASRKKYEASSSARAQATRQTFAAGKAQSEKALAEAAQDESAEKEANRRRREAMLAEWNARIERENQKHADERSKLTALLRRTVQIKEASRKSEFPAYAAARRGGFKEGTKPSQAEMEATSEERATAEFQIRLGRGF